MGEESDELFDAYMKYAFSPDDGPAEYDPEETRRPVGDRRGLFHPSLPNPVSVCRHYWLEASVRGQSHPMAGLTSVITPPEHRREGYTKRVLSESLREYRERGQHFSLLWPFDYSFYKAFGWDTANDRRSYEGEIDALSFALNRFDGNGAYTQVGLDELTTLNPVYEEHTRGHSLAIDRDQNWWRHRVSYARPTEPFVYRWDRDGKPKAYVVYTFENTDNGRCMNVREYRYVDLEALYAILAFCYNHGSQADRVRLLGPNTPIVHDQFDAPDAFDCTLTTGPMVRIVDVAETLGALSYPNVDTELTIAVDDAFAECNDGVFSLELTGGDATCRPVGDDMAAAPDVRLDISALSQLAVGYRSARVLDQADRLEGASETTLATLTQLFPTTTVYLPERF